MWKSQCCGSVIILLCLLNVVQVQAQCSKLQPGENRVPTEDKETFANGETATFKCGYGYTPVDATATRTVTCQSGSWSNLVLQCKKKSCGNPGEITNGYYDTSAGTDFGSVITGKCNPGFLPTGMANTRKCLDNGWDGRATTCEAVKCPQPSTIQGGSFSPVNEIYEYQQTISYSCNDKKLTLVGAKDITCSVDGHFHPDPPQCKSISCPSVRVENGQRTEGKQASTYNYREFLKFVCNEGFVMVGSDQIRCDADGWTPSPPTCVPGTTRNPVPPTRKPFPGPSPVPPSDEPHPPSSNLLWILLGVGVAIAVVGGGAFAYHYKKGSPDRSFALKP